MRELSVEHALDVVIPVYNEGSTIRETLEVLGRLVQTSLRVIVVYDFDADDTLPVVKDMMEKIPYKLELHKNRYGRGALNAIKTGMMVGDSGTVVVVMADFSDDLAKIDNMFRILQTGYDIVCGSRYMRGGMQIGGPRLKKFLSRTAGLSLRYLLRFPTHDVTNSFKMYRRSLLSEMQIESVGGFEIGMEITVKAYLRGKKITEVPVTWTDRSSGKSKFKLWKWMPHYLRWYSLAFLRRSSRIQNGTGSRHV